MKKYLWIFFLLLIVIAGCGRDRLADIATPEEIESKDMIVILPSVPEEFCYADRMTEILDDFAVELNGTNPQVLSAPTSLDCSDYGFVNCTEADLGVGEYKNHVFAEECLSDDGQHFCLYILGDEYRDAEGNTFDESCIMGIDKNKKDIK